MHDDSVTVPLCDYCWSLEGNYASAFKLREEVIKDEAEVCHNCGDRTNSGIYVQLVPNDINIKETQ